MITENIQSMKVNVSAVRAVAVCVRGAWGFLVTDCRHQLVEHNLATQLRLACQAPFKSIFGVWFSVEAAIVANLSELDDVFLLKEEQRIFDEGSPQGTTC